MSIKYSLKKLEKDYGPLTFSDLLLIHREDMGWTQTRMAKELKLSKQKLCDFEKERRLPSVKMAVKWASKLATIFLCGSTLEGILLGVATNNPKIFNSANASPKKNNEKVLEFQDWTLKHFIDVAKEVDFLNEDVKKFSHALRYFRNYIHPYEQASQKFNPDEHTAKLCFQVLKVAIHQIAKRQK